MDCRGSSSSSVIGWRAELLASAVLAAVGLKGQQQQGLAGESYCVKTAAVLAAVEAVLATQGWSRQQQESVAEATVPYQQQQQQDSQGSSSKDGRTSSSSSRQFVRDGHGSVKGWLEVGLSEAAP